MDNSVKCFSVVSSAVEEATSRFAPLWAINNEKYEILEQYCEAIDSLASEFDGESFEAEVDDIKMTVGIKMACESISISSQKHRYYDLTQRAVFVGFSAGENGCVVVAFVFPSVWDKKAAPPEAHNE